MDETLPVHKINIPSYVLTISSKRLPLQNQKITADMFFTDKIADNYDDIAMHRYSTSATGSQ